MRKAPRCPGNFNLARALLICSGALLVAAAPFVRGEENAARDATAIAESKAAAADAALTKKAAGWVAALQLGDAEKEARVTQIIVAHLKAVRDWHNAHPFSSVPAATNPATGKPLGNLERQIIADRAMPRSVHEDLMNGLRRELTEAQLEKILDDYTIGKVAFTLAGYHAIVPDLTAEEERTILGFLKQAREEAIDFKNMNEISAVFEIYKTKSEQYLNSNGRNWKALYKAYAEAAKARKAAASSMTAPGGAGSN